MREQRPDRAPRAHSNASGPGTYEVSVRGRLTPRDVERLGGLVVTSVSGDDESVTTVLRGRLADQSALMGVMNALHAWQIPVLGVERVSGRGADE